MLKKFGIDGIYIIHAKKGYELHEARIQKLFAKYNLEYELVTDGDPSLFNTIDLGKYFIPEIRKTMTDGVLSCTLNHILSFEKVVANKNKYAIIFENDPFFIGNFLKKMERLAKEADTVEPGFFISLENTTLKFPSIWKTKPGKYLYQAKGSRCAGAYMIDNKGASDILQSLQTVKCNTVIDWWQNQLIERGVVKMYWAHPAVTEQGSHNGLLCSSISSKEKSLKRRLRWNLQKIYKTTFRRLFSRNLVY